MSNPHLIDGEFQSDKYPTTPRGKVPLSTKDPMAQDLLWQYAQRRRAVDADFADALQEALTAKGYKPGGPIAPEAMPAPNTIIVYSGGHFAPAMVHWATENCDLGHIAREAGFECRWLRLDEDLPEDDPIYVDWSEYGASADDILPRWQPTEQGDGWVLSGKWDTEDGPTALFLRPLQKKST